MVVITYEDKMEFLENLKMRAKLLHETCEACFPQRDIDILECIMEDVNEIHEQNKKNEKMTDELYEELFLKEGK